MKRDVKNAALFALVVGALAYWGLKHYREVFAACLRAGNSKEKCEFILR